VTHGHISIGNRRVFTPSLLVPSEIEDQIGYTTTSSLSDPNHALRVSLVNEDSGGNLVEQEN
jgi:ribosomal protein S4